MDVRKQALDTIETAKLNRLFQSDDYAFLRRVIQCAHDAALFDAKLESVEFLLDPTLRDSALEQHRVAARLKVAIDVLDELEKPDTEKFTITVDTP